MIFKKQMFFLCFFILFTSAFSEINKCNMTYMYSMPIYQEIIVLNLTPSPYKLYYYTEKHLPSKKVKYKGKPILFLPGNCGSYRQVRSMASVTLDKIISVPNNRIEYDFFSIDFNEEKSAFSGLVLEKQTDYSSFALRHLLKHYIKNGVMLNKMSIIGHSLGGMIAKGIFMDEKIDPRHIDLIITLATPHKVPIIPWDPAAQAYYQKVRSFWTKKDAKNHSFPPILSLAGGSRDQLVPIDYVQIEHINDFRHDLEYSTTHLVDVWLSNDHLSIVWCNQLMRLLSRILLNLPALAAIEKMVEFQSEGKFRPKNVLHSNSSKIKDFQNLEKDAILDLEITQTPLLLKTKKLTFLKVIRIADLNTIGPICVYLEGVRSLKETVLVEASFEKFVKLDIKQVPPSGLKRYIVKIEAIQDSLGRLNNFTKYPLEVNVLLPVNLRFNPIVLVDRCASNYNSSYDMDYFWLAKNTKIERKAIYEYSLHWLAEIWQGYYAILMVDSKCKSQRMVTMIFFVAWFKENRYWTRTEDAAKTKSTIFEIDLFLQTLPLNKFNKPLPPPRLILTLNPECKYELIFKVSPKLILRQLFLYQNYYIIKAIILFYLIELTLSANDIIKFVKTSNYTPVISHYSISCILHFLAYFTPFILTKIYELVLSLYLPYNGSTSGDNLYPSSLLNHLFLCILSQSLALCLHVFLRVLLTASFWLGHRLYIKSNVSIENKKQFSWPRVLNNKLAVVCALFVTLNYVWAPYISWSAHFFLVYILVFPLLNAKSLKHFQSLGVYINYFTSLLCLIACLMLLHTHTFIHLTHESTYPYLKFSLLFALFPLHQYPWYWVIFKCILLSLMLPQILIPDWCLEASYICPLARLFKSYYFTVWITPLINGLTLFWLPRYLAFNLTLLVELNFISVTCHVIFIVYDLLLHHSTDKTN